MSKTFLINAPNVQYWSKVHLHLLMNWSWRAKSFDSISLVFVRIRQTRKYSFKVFYLSWLVTRDCFALERNAFKIKIAWFPDLWIGSSPPTSDPNKFFTKRGLNISYDSFYYLESTFVVTIFEFMMTIVVPDRLINNVLIDLQQWRKYVIRADEWALGCGLCSVLSSFRKMVKLVSGGTKNNQYIYSCRASEEQGIQCI